jgi:hypothetical protein
LRKFLRDGKGSTRAYTEEERMHATAIYFTPELPRTWIAYQFAKRGLNSDKYMVRFRKIALNPKNPPHWRELGIRNLQFIGPEELLYYYQRSNPNKQHTHPSWAIAIFNELVKQGRTQRSIEAEYGLKPTTICDFKFTGRNSLTPVKNNGIVGKEEFLDRIYGRNRVNKRLTSTP